MLLESKFNLNDSVFYITEEHEEKFIMCLACSGSGTVILNDAKERKCPECYGRGGENKSLLKKWIVKNQLTIGQIGIEIQSLKKTNMFSNIGEYDPKSQTKKVEYMCYETGVGSGNIYKEEVFFSSKEEAQQECDKRNQE